MHKDNNTVRCTYIYIPIVGIRRKKENMRIYREYY